MFANHPERLGDIERIWTAIAPDNEPFHGDPDSKAIIAEVKKRAEESPGASEDGSAN
jgi:hypothetical protein